jgi:hypothetical protein
MVAAGLKSPYMGVTATIIIMVRTTKEIHGKILLFNIFT